MTNFDNSNFQTPTDVCEYMADLVLPYSPKNVLEPTPGAGNLVHVLKEKGLTTHEPVDFWKDTLLSEYGAVVMNPPFSPMTDGYKILYRCMTLSSVVIALMPWLTIINSQKRTADIVDFGLKSITHLPRNVFPGSRVQCCILEMVLDFDGQTVLKFYT